MWKSSRIPVLSKLITVILLLGVCTPFVEGNASPKISVLAPQGRNQTPLQRSHSSSSYDEVVVRYSLASSRLTLHEPIILNFTVDNNRTERVRFDLGQDRKQGFRFVVVRPDATSIRLSRGLREGSSLIGALALDSHETYTQALLLNEWFEFATPGKYEIDVSLATPIQDQQGRPLAVQVGGHFTLEIEPRDAEQLRLAGASLLERIVKASSYEEAAEAAIALSYIGDPVVIVNLEKALNSGRMVEQIAVRGLERIGNYEAVLVLISVLKSKSRDTAQFARSALVHIENRSSDPVLKEQIKRAL